MFEKKQSPLQKKTEDIVLRRGEVASIDKKHADEYVSSPLQLVVKFKIGNALDSKQICERWVKIWGMEIMNMEPHISHCR